MKRSEIAQILTMAKALDDRVTVDEARVLAWEMALAEGMDFDFAREALAAHYRTSDRVVMPVYLNERWKAHRADLAASRAIAAGRTEGVPPTQEFKDIVAQLRERNGQRSS